jgi:Flp pilus assembly protein TadD
LFVHLVVYGAAENAAAGVGAGALVPRSIYLFTQTMVLPHYLRLSVWPSDLSFEYRDWPGYSKWTSVWPYLLGVGLALAMAAYGVIRGRWYGFLGTWFFAILSLTSLVPIVDFVEEYRMYLPLIAVIVGLVLGGERLLSHVRQPRMRQAIAIVLVVGVASALGVRTWLRNADYATDITLWSRNLETRRGDSKAYMHLAMAQEQLGEFVEAEEFYRIAILKAEGRFLPEADQRLTTLLLLHGDMAGANRELPFALGATVDTVYYDAILKADGGDAEGALLRITEMDQRFPHLSPLKMLEAQLLAELGKTQESEAAVAEALAIFPGYADYAQLKARTWLKTRYFANPIGRRMTLAFAQQAVMASRGQDASALECLAAAKGAK